MAKKQNKRSKSKYPALDKSLSLKTRGDLVDFDYLHLLDEKALKFLNKFVEETVHDSMDRKNLKKNLYARTKKKKKECGDMNNARNRDIMSRQKAQGKMDSFEEAFPSEIDYEEYLRSNSDGPDNDPDDSAT